MLSSSVLIFGVPLIIGTSDCELSVPPKDLVWLSVPPIASRAVWRRCSSCCTPTVFAFCFAFASADVVLAGSSSRSSSLLKKARWRRPVTVVPLTIAWSFLPMPPARLLAAAPERSPPASLPMAMVAAALDLPRRPKLASGCFAAARRRSSSASAFASRLNTSTSSSSSVSNSSRLRPFTLSRVRRVRATVDPRCIALWVPLSMLFLVPGARGALDFSCDGIMLPRRTKRRSAASESRRTGALWACSSRFSCALLAGAFFCGGDDDVAVDFSSAGLLLPPPIVATGSTEVLFFCARAFALCC
mmetsp:Transcript_43357/g.133935  ORF Transcript_43357/g.133935 Transcript_43357/m.133935 type:complete len:302 (+) Transcript_43357:1243-2148(+)